METKSIKSLAIKVLQRNTTGNQKETSSFPNGNSEPRKFPVSQDLDTPALLDVKDKLKPASLPFLDLDGSLVIPFGSDSRYHWWKGGQSMTKTEEELRGWKH